MSEKTTLYFRQDNSDKVYVAELLEQGEGFIVNFAYGRRGSTMTTGTKTKEAIPEVNARRIYNKLIQEKKAKGYIEGEDTGSYVPPETTVSSEVVQCQLLTAVEDEQWVTLLCKDASYAAQQKFDGIRLILTAEGGRLPTIVGYNRSGKPRGIHEDLVAAAQHLQKRIGSFTLDGESIGDEFFAFDMLEHRGEDLRSWGFEERYRELSRFVDLGGLKALHRAATYFTQESKAALVKAQYEQGEEGVVFKPIAAPYRPGRQADHYKVKFTAESSVVVLRNNAKASVAMGVYDEKGTMVEVGNCSLRDSSWKLDEGDIIDVRYLYAYRGGSLFQPRMIRKRDDITRKDCVIGQLRFKKEARNGNV